MLASAGDGNTAPAGISFAVLADALPGLAAMTASTSKNLRWAQSQAREQSSGIDSRNLFVNPVPHAVHPRLLRSSSDEALGGRADGSELSDGNSRTQKPQLSCESQPHPLFCGSEAARGGSQRGWAGLSEHRGLNRIAVSAASIFPFSCCV